MKRLTYMMGLALICAATACNDASKDASIDSKADTSANSTAATTDQTPTVQDTAAMNKAWMEYMTPGAMHSQLAQDNGTWTVETTMWMSPDAPPSKSTGTATNKMIMGGRYQQSNFKGDIMGQPFEGISTLGYDNAKKVFVNTWIDNMGTGIMSLEGTYDSVNHQINFSGKQTDPTTGKDCMLRQTYKMVDENTQKMEMFATYPGGKEYKTMELVYKRKK